MQLWWLGKRVRFGGMVLSTPYTLEKVCFVGYGFIVFLFKKKKNFLKLPLF